MLSRYQTGVLARLAILLLVSCVSCAGSGSPSAQDGSREGELTFVDGATTGDGPRSDGRSGDDASRDSAPRDLTRPDAGPPAKPFGVWTSQCSAAAAAYQTVSNNAYPTELQQAVADDWTYVAWVWRQQSGAEYNHSVSAMKSKDLKTWYNLCGAQVTLPVTPKSATVIDPVPIKAGLLNSRLVLSFDSAKRAVITYQKNVSKKLADGSTKLTTQVFNARWEGSSIRIYQLTSWDSLNDFGGGGSLPSTDTSISFSGLRLAPSGVVAQTVTRSVADNNACKTVEGLGKTCSAYPKSGTWEIQDSAKGLALRSPLTAVSAATLASLDPFENPATPALDTGAVENKPLSSSANAAKWAVRMRRSRSETRWITLRSDFDGDGSNNRGLYDRYNARFHLDEGGTARVFQFGAREGLFWPITGDWDQDGKDTIGIHDPRTALTYLKNSLAGGAADKSLKGPIAGVPGVKDSPLVWHPVNPAARYAIRWETLPTNNDCPYTCQGVSLWANNACQSGSPCLDGQLMSSNLYLFEYDAATNAWKKSLIDRAWSGTSVGFDFLTFKNVQLVLYYGQDRQAKIAQRVRSGGVWSAWAFSKLATQFGGWDGHNYLTMTVDANHNVHVTGNMHASDLNYFRSSGFFGGAAPLTYNKLDMTSLNANKARVTYPVFSRSMGGEILFAFRRGSSGNGDTYLNHYDESKSTWTPLHGTTAAPTPLFKGAL